MSEADFNPFPDEDGTVYRYTGSGLQVPTDTGKAYVEAGETVRLPDRVADHIGDALEDPDAGADDAAAEVEQAAAADADEAEAEEEEGDESGGETSTGSGELAVPDDVDAEDLPEDFPEELPTDDYPLMQRLASENDLDAQVDRPTLVESLENARDAGGD